jgi:hypothetical protein
LIANVSASLDNVSLLTGVSTGVSTDRNWSGLTNDNQISSMLENPGRPSYTELERENINLKVENNKLHAQLDKLKLDWESDEPGKQGTMLRGLYKIVEELTGHQPHSSKPLAVYFMQWFEEQKQEKYRLEQELQRADEDIDFYKEMYYEND